MGGVVLSRLLIILLEREVALAEIHSILKPGGRCFVAEPQYRCARCGCSPVSQAFTAIDPGVAGSSVLSSEEFRGIVRSQPWGDIRHWKDAWYQYAVREKART